MAVVRGSMAGLNITARRKYFDFFVRAIFKDQPVASHWRKREYLQRIDNHERAKYEEMAKDVLPTDLPYANPLTFRTKIKDVTNIYYFKKQDLNDIVFGGHLPERQLEQEDPEFWNLSRWNPVRELQVQTETWSQISGLIRKFANESIFHYNLVKMEPLITSEKVASSSVDELYKMMQECKLTPEEIETQKQAEERMDKDMWGAQVYKTPQELQRETVQQTQLQAEKNK